MRPPSGALLAVGLLASVLSGCLGSTRAPQIRYYTIAVGAAEQRTAPRLPFAVRVGTFGAAPPYRSTRIARRRSRYRLDYYDFNRWAANPQSLLAAAVQNYFDKVGTPTASDVVRVSGRVDRLEAVTHDGGLRAVAAITFDAEDHTRHLLQRAYVEKVPVDGDEPEHVVAAISRALDRVLSRFTADLAAARAAVP